LNKLKISFLIFCALLFPYKIYAFEFGKVQSAIKSEPIEIEDINAYLNLNIFKYKLCLTKGSKISVTFKNVAHNQLIFSHQIDVKDDKKDINLNNGTKDMMIEYLTDNVSAEGIKTERLLELFEEVEQS
jgi:hypothetical protein